MKHYLFLFIISINFCLVAQESKLKGVSFVASREAVSEENIAPLLKLNANYAAVMPFGFIKDVQNPDVLYNTERQWYGETVKGVKQYLHTLREKEIRIMLKPQLWIWDGVFTGTLKPSSDEKWKVLESSYRNFILEFAQLAQEENVAIFCIGTELEQFINNRPEYWSLLIQDIKKIYTGKLTYAANWDEYTSVPFWKQLDFIGVDAYFPISEEKTPTEEDAKKGWIKWMDELKSVSEIFNKKIIFTEYGYRNVDFSGKEPWHSGRENKTINHAAQGNLLTGLFESVWQEPWMGGGFLWKWYPNNEQAGGGNNNRFTIQNKPAQLIIQYYYAH